MDSEKDVSNSDVNPEYLETALQIFDFCGADSNGTLRVETLMEKIAPLVKTNKCEPDLRSLLDPDMTNPRISVTMLSNTLKKYSENPNNKVDLEESFNLRSGPVPQDSDSGISSDGFQLLEELQCELREKDRLAAQLRTELNLSDQQHEDAVASLVAERDALKAQLHMLREENSSLLPVRADYDEICEKLSASDAALGDARRALDAARRRAQHAQGQIAGLEGDKQILQELLNKSKDECHRINDMYASRQAALIEQNEALRTECAELATRLQDQEEVVQTLAKEKVRIEMELKDQLNKSTIQSRLDRSIEVSYTEEQLLSALDSLNSDSRFTQDMTLDDVSFFQYHEDPGRPTNMSLFDEIRLSIGNISKLKDIEQAFTENSTVANDYFGSSKDFVDFGFKTTETQCKACSKLRLNDLDCVEAESGVKDGNQSGTKDYVGEINWPECKTNNEGRADVFNTDIGLGRHRPQEAVTQCENQDFGLKDVVTECAVKIHELEKMTQNGLKEFCDAATQWKNENSGLKDAETQCAVTDSEVMIATQSGAKSLVHAVTQWEHKDSGLKDAETQCAVKISELEKLTQNVAKELCDAFTQWEYEDSGLKDAGTQCGVTVKHAQIGTQWENKEKNEIITGIKRKDLETQSATKISELEKLTQYKAKELCDAFTQWEYEESGLKDAGTQCGVTVKHAQIGTQWENKEKDEIIRGIKRKDWQKLCGPTDSGLKNVESHYETKSTYNRKNSVNSSFKSQERQNKVQIENNNKNNSVNSNFRSQIRQNKVQIESNNNNLDTKCEVCICTECGKIKEYATKLESDLTYSRSLTKELHLKMDAYVENLRILKQTSDEEHQANNALKANIKTLKVKLVLLEKACKQQKEELDGLYRDTTSTTFQACPEVSSVWTQADEACADCAARALLPKKTWRNRLWDGFTSVFSVLALLCFTGAICFLYQVSHYHFASKRCGERLSVPWSWLRVADVLDAVFRVEYVGERPM